MKNYNDIKKIQSELQESLYALDDELREADRDYRRIKVVLNHMAQGHDVTRLIDNLKTYTTDDNGDCQVECDEELINALAEINVLIQEKR